VPGANSFSSAQSLSSGAGCVWVASADLNGDGRLDLVSVDAGAQTISIFENIAASGSLGAESFCASLRVLDIPAGGTRY